VEETSNDVLTHDTARHECPDVGQRVEAGAAHSISSPRADGSAHEAFSRSFSMIASSGERASTFALHRAARELSR
jgi:hypothetical protein